MKVVLVIALGVALISPASATCTPAVQSDLFVDSLGLNIHSSYSEYSNWSTVQSRLQALGIRHVRDGVNTSSANLQTLGPLGIKVTAITRPDETQSQLVSWQNQLGSTLEAFEGPNEYDISHPGSDTNWQQTLRNYMPTVWSMKSASVSIIGPSLTSSGAYSSVGDLSAYMDWGTMHDYSSWRNPGTSGWGGTDSCGVYGAMSWNMCWARKVAGTKPIAPTENGWQESDVPDAGTKARYVLRDYLMHWLAGTPRNFLFELKDDSGQTYGILNTDYSVRQSYTELQNFISLLADPGPAFVPMQLNYTASGPSDLKQLLLGKRDGTWRLVLWRESQEYDGNSKTLTPSPQATVSLSFNTTKRVSAVTIYGSGAPQNTTITPNPSGFTLPVDGHVTIVTITL